MMARLDAEESLLVTRRFMFGSGHMDPSDARHQLHDWERQATAHPEPMQRSSDDRLRAVGTRVVYVPKKKTDPAEP
jgi:hypothetical protein